MYDTTMYALGAKRSAIRALFDYGQEQAAKVGKENVFDFSIGNPSIPAPNCVQDEIVRLAREEAPAAIHGYTPAPGDPVVRQGVADYMNQTFQANVTGNNFYMTCGASASLAIILRALIAENEDEIIVNAPFFPEYRVFIQNAGGRLVMVPPDTEQFQLSMTGLAEAITSHTKAVIINTPNNPSGSVYSADTLMKLGELLRCKSAEFGHPIFLISDEPYREVIYDGLPVLYVPEFYKNTVICYSYSKSLSLPGERVGYILVPNEVDGSREIFTAVCGSGRSMGFVCAPHLFQKVILACQGKTANIGIYDSNRKLIYHGLTDIGFQCVYPSGAFYLFVKAPDGDANQFMENAKKLNILIVPGDEFGCPGYCRISYCVDPDMIRRSLPVFKQLYELYSHV
ncbi:pyridoxal phosphate-dependent aminotransferase [uncultured Megasphaera sp.]|uniref:pyridoxal phosphate-dependent aminotransferase n=1 Tax=uncultured Megasphaera sp. TaxID=165188 RepID=UPI00265864F8|nr:pyridoxal phosphate-dependent aminotransferase [uncultured Megasphaera sp.]